MKTDVTVSVDLSRCTRARWARRIRRGEAAVFPVNLGGRWSTQVLHRRGRNIALSLASAALGVMLTARPAAALIEHWETRSVSLTGREAAALFARLNAPEVASNGGFRQPSRMKAALFGPLAVFCDTHAAPVCTVSWPDVEEAGDGIHVGAEDAGGVPPCRGPVEAIGETVAFRCDPEGLSVRRRLSASSGSRR